MGYGRKVDDKLDKISYLQALVRPSIGEEDVEYVSRKVLGGNVTVNERVNKEPTVADKRKSMPVYSGVLKYFPKALKEVSKCSLAGQKQHNIGNELYWDKSKSTDNEDALVRHLIDHTISPMDDDGVLHLAKVAWRALAALEIHLGDE
jgi:hypothetical protein